MSENENPASTGMLDGADSEIAGRDDGINSTASTVKQTSESRKRLCAAGFMPIPVIGKKPTLKNWQEKVDTNDGELDIWAKVYPGADGTGLLTRYLPTLDIDIKNPDAAEAVEQLVRDRFEDAGVVLVRFGNKPKRAIPFRTATPYKKITVNLIAPDESVDQKLELLADGQQVVAFGVHPDTRQPYAWFGGEPGVIRREELPALSEVQAQQLVDDAAELLVREHGYVRARERPKAKTSPGNGSSASNGADWGFLTDSIHAGRDLHDSLRDLAAKLVRSGMSAGAVVNFLYGLMDSSFGPHDVRWAERRHDIPRLVDSAAELVSPPPPIVELRNLAEVHEVFIRWLGKDFEVATLDAMLATAAAERMEGDPAWLLIISGPGNAKTETVQALSMLGAHVVSTITSDAALLSASPAKQKAKDATGGLLRKIGDRGILAIKDVTSILSMDRNVRGQVLAALREVHDGNWTRNVGTDGGKTLSWTGRVAVIGACTTAWDQAHAVISTMGDRFVLVRSDSHLGRVGSGLRAMQNTGVEVVMRKEMAEAVAGVVNAVVPADIYMLTASEESTIVEAANVVTLARTGVESDYRGDVIDAHAPEMPTRFAKQLTQIMRGAMAIGMTKVNALQLVIRCARDSMPQIRLAVLHDVAAHPESKVIDVRRRLQKPRATIDRTLQALHMLGLLTLEEEEADRGGKTIQIRKYSLTAGVNLAALD